MVEHHDRDDNSKNWNKTYFDVPCLLVTFLIETLGDHPVVTKCQMSRFNL